MAKPQLKKDDDDDFKLPEKTVEADDTIEIEIVDDTPEADRGKEPIPEKDIGPDPDESEIENYSEGVKKRINKLTAEKNDQRRKKEAAERQVNEASQLVIGYQNELNRMREVQAQGEVQALKEAKKRVESDLGKARTAYKAAVEAGDADQMTDAQEALAVASAERTHIDRVMPAEPIAPQMPQQPQYQQPQYQQAQPPIDPKTTRWVQNNPWFEADGNEDKTFTAYGIHYKMVGEGFDPRTDEYYEELDTRIRTVYPDLSTGGPTKARRKPPQTVVASAHREPGSPTKVQMTSSEVDLARKLGVTNEVFAKEKLRLEQLEE